jgi:hypothetical protein
MKTLYLISAMTIVFFSCKEKEEKIINNNSKPQASLVPFNPTDGNLSAMSIFSGTLNGFFSVLCQTAYNPNGTSNPYYTYELNGRIANDHIGSTNDQSENAGNLSINNDVFSPDGDYRYHATTINNGSSYYGSNNTISFAGGPNINQTSTQFYVPQKMLLTSGPATFDLSKGGVNSFSWTPDNNNNNGKVYVSVVYKGALSKETVDPNLPEDDIIFQAEVDDSQGSYTIPANVLGNMPTNGLIDVTFGRGSGSIVNTGNHNVMIVFGSITYNTFSLNP